MNWKYVTTMKILLAVVNTNNTNTNITSIIETHVYRNTVLFLPDPIRNITTKADEGSTISTTNGTTLTVAYSISIGTTVTKNCVISFDMSTVNDTPILISPFGYNDNAMYVMITEENGTTGVIHRGIVYTTKAEVPNTQTEQHNAGTILEYSIDHSHCQFSIAIQ